MKNSNKYVLLKCSEIKNFNIKSVSVFWVEGSPSNWVYCCQYDIATRAADQK